MSVQEITLQVPIDYSLPLPYESADAKATAQMLTLGAISYETMQVEGQKLSHETLFENLQTKAQAELLPRLTAAEEAAATLRRRLQEEQQFRQDTEQRVRQEEQRNREELLKEKDRRITALETQLTGHWQQVEASSRNLTEGFQVFKEQMLRNTTGSTLKGKQGETVFADLIRRAFGATDAGEIFDVEEVGKEGHQGDLRMTWKGHKIMWEVKNYTRNVETKEVTKFLRDMAECKDMSLGVMVSLNSGIAGHTKAGGIDLEELSDGRICIYLTNFFKSEEDPTLALQALRPFLETFLKRRSTTAQATDDQRIYQFEQQRALLMRLFQHHQETVNKFKNAFVNAKKKQDAIWLELSAEMRQTEHGIKMILETMMDDSPVTTTQTTTASTLIIPGYVFRHTDPALYTEKERTYLNQLLQVFRFAEDVQMTTTVFKEALKTVNLGEEAIRIIRDRLLLDDVWPKGSKVLKYFMVPS